MSDTSVKTPRWRNRKNGITAALVLCVALTLWFIWGNSGASGTASQSASDRVSAILTPILNPRGAIDPGIFRAFVRKLAHFVEFAALGAELWALAWHLRKPRINPFFPAFCALASAVTDEFIQSFRDRSPQVSDVILDFGGAVTGMLCMALLLLLIRACVHARRRRKSQNTRRDRES